MPKGPPGRRRPDGLNQFANYEIWSSVYAKQRKLRSRNPLQRTRATFGRG